MESSFNKTYLKTEHIIPYHIHVTHNSRTWGWVMVFNATFKHALAIWWQSVVIGTDCTGSCNSETCVYHIYIVDTNIIYIVDINIIYIVDTNIIYIVDINIIYIVDTNIIYIVDTNIIYIVDINIIYIVDINIIYIVDINIIYIVDINIIYIVDINIIYIIDINIIYLVDTNNITYKYNINLCQNFISIWKNNIYFCIFHLFESHQSQRVKYIIAKLKLDLYFVLQVVSPLKKNFINVNYKTELILSGNH